MSNHDFGKYKKSKVVVKELTTLLKIIELSISGITPFTKYNSIPETLMCLRDNKIILEVHLQHHQNIIKNKGEVTSEA